MFDARQFPLLEPQSPEDLNPHSEFRFVVPLFQQYLLHEGKSQHTVNAFTSDLHLLADYTGGETAIGSYTTDQLNDFLHWLEAERGVPCSRKTYARRVTTLKVLFKWLHEIEALPHDPAKAVLQRSGPAPLATILMPAEIEACLVAARRMKTRDEHPDPRPEMLFRLILDTGIKKSEAMTLTPEDINRAESSRPQVLVRYKSRNVYKERLITLEADWLRVFDAYMAVYAPPKGIFNCTARNLEYILEAIGTAAGLPYKISFEMLRWTCAVRDRMAGLDEDTVRDKLGLSPISWNETGSKVQKLIEQLQRKQL